MMRARSHRYPDSDDENYIDTTHYDDTEQYLDVGYQRLKIFNTNTYPQLKTIKKLYIDHNCLKNLPDPKYLPCLIELTCASNKLNSVPFYPNLIFLNIAENNITDLSHYHNSNLEYLDCSFNKNFKINFKLPKCKQLYITDCRLQTLDLALLPILKILDCGNNDLTNISESKNLVELNIQYNKLTEIPKFDKIKRVTANHNKITKLNTYPELTSININHNELIKIDNQPNLRKLIANNNHIKDLGEMSKLELIDLSHNKISNYSIPLNAEFVSLQFNPINDIQIENQVFRTIKELQINFATYKNIYQKYYDNFDAVNVKINNEKLNEILHKLDTVFNKSTHLYIIKQFNKTKFQDRADALLKITLRLYLEHFSKKNNVSTMEELYQTSEFKYLLENITKLYYKTITITLYFNGYY